MTSLMRVPPSSLSASLRFHPDGPLSPGQIQEEIKGWVQFVTEEWAPDANDEHELRLRYNLVERWATADQSFRDAYHLRAAASQSASLPTVLSVNEADINRFVCLAPVDRETHPDNYCRLLKILILLYMDQDGFGTGHPFGSGNIGGPTPQIPTNISGSDHDIALEDILSARFLWTPDFRVVSMTRTGTVLFTKLYDHLGFAVDQSGLETGRLTALEFQPNGQIEHSVVWRAFNLGQVMIFYYGQGYKLDALIEEHIGGPPWVNQPLDMNLPILDILDTTNNRGEFRFANWGNRESWSRSIEQYAPGYLELEARGQAVEFNLANLQELPR